MNLKEYFSSSDRGEQKRVANELRISNSYMSQIVSGSTNISNIRCVEIEQATNGQVTRQELRPEDWHLIWPELVEENDGSEQAT